MHAMEKPAFTGGFQLWGRGMEGRPLSAHASSSRATGIDPRHDGHHSGMSAGDDYQANQPCDQRGNHHELTFRVDISLLYSVYTHSEFPPSPIRAMNGGPVIRANAVHRLFQCNSSAFCASVSTPEGQKPSTRLPAAETPRTVPRAGGTEKTGASALLERKYM